jgi:hypothetical protein
MDLKCFVFPGWEPRIRAASPQRGWMDEAAEAFPYRCLPLAIANSHGWELLSPCGFEVEWNGGLAVEDVIVRPDPGARPQDEPVALFGQGTFTLHIQGLLRTPPGWNLHVSGPPNSFKDGASALSGIIETDWSPYTFTMNWRLTRPGHVVRFEENEPIAHIFPVERSSIEAVTPSFVPIDEDPELKASFLAWSRSRDAFHEQMRLNPPERPADKWQKLYYRGLTPDGRCPVGDHQAKLKPREFANAELVRPKEPARPAAKPARSQPRPQVQPQPQPQPQLAESEAAWKVAKYEWLLETQERQRSLSAQAGGLFRCQGLTGEQFLSSFYAPGRPVILVGAIDAWPARTRWTPEYLRSRVGSAEIELQGGRDANHRFELDKDAHRRRMPFDRFIDLVTEKGGNDLYLTAYNGAANAAAFAPLEADIGGIDQILDPRPDGQGRMLWIGPAGTFTPLHHDLTNNLLVQVTGRKRVLLVPTSQTPKLYHRTDVFSVIPDVTDPVLDRTAFPKAKDIRCLDLVLEPGEALYIPIAWWHQVRALDFSVSMTFTNFRWPNAGHADHPART